jgi:hypothetical protein
MKLIHNARILFMETIDLKVFLDRARVNSKKIRRLMREHD